MSRRYLDQSGLELFALQQASSHQDQIGSFKCPKCNKKHEYRPAVGKDDIKDFQVFSSAGQLVCSNGTCAFSSNEQRSNLYALGACGHLLCGNEFEQLGGTIGEEASQIDCPTCSKDDGKGNQEPVPVSHGARVVTISGSESCPVCWEDYSKGSTMVALSCGHLFCMNDFMRLGGKVGPDSLLTYDEMVRQFQEHIQRLQAKYGTTIRQLVARLSTSNEAEAIGSTLSLLALGTSSTDGDAATFLQHGGPGAVVHAMRRFQQSRLVIQLGSKVLGQLLCIDHRDVQEQTTNAQATIEAGALTLCLDILQEETTTVPILVSIASLLLLPMFRCIPFLTALPDSIGTVKIMVSTALDVMKRSPESALLQSSLIIALKAATFHCHDSLGAQIHSHLVKIKGMEVIAEDMRRYPEDGLVMEAAIGALCHLGHNRTLIPRIQKLGAIEMTCKAMQDHALEYYVQRNGCSFLWAVANCKNGKAKPICEALVSSHAVQRLQATMLHYQDSDEIQEKSCSALESMVKAFKRVALDVVRSGCVEQIVTALENHQRSPQVCYQATLALSRLSEYKDREIRMALMETNAIRAIHEISRHADAVLMAPMRGGFVPPGNPLAESSPHPFVLMQLSELLSDTLEAKLGVQDTCVLNDDTYDFDNDKEYRDDIQFPPFDVTNILGRDLSTDAPGWYRALPFIIDRKHSEVLEDKNNDTFLHEPTEPKVGNKVAIRIAIPFGGRGYLYGTVTSVGPSPSDDVLREFSYFFENPCSCPGPTCPLKTGSREGIMSVFGALPGQEVTAAVSLESPYLERKLRFAPLPEFFGGEDVSYKVVLRFFDEPSTWKVVKISRNG